MGGNCKGLYIAEKEKKLQRLKPFGRLWFMKNDLCFMKVFFIA